MIVARSGLYREARHRSGLATAFLVLLGLLMLERQWTAWGWHAANGVWLVLATAMAYGLGAWAGGWPPLIRLMTSRERRAHKVRLRAERAFAQLGVAQTRERTGVLLFVSLLEHQVSVMPDRALAKRIPPTEWHTVVNAVIGPIKRGHIAEGLCAGIEQCGALLVARAPALPESNPNELPDRLRFES